MLIRGGTNWRLGACNFFVLYLYLFKIFIFACKLVNDRSSVVTVGRALLPLVFTSKSVEHFKAVGSVIHNAG